MLAQTPQQGKFIRSLDRMMAELAPHSARDSRIIRQAYRDYLDLLVLDRYAELEIALYTGGLARLPADPARFNVAPRLTGPFPIGEKDLGNQVSYIAARPATIGCLLDIASRVKTGPVEVTSLVRHSEYQGALRATNKNATASVPMHTMGLAFDIALVNTPLETVFEIRDVLRRMHRAGDLLFIAERKQLVFHVVPHPSRLGHFTEVYAQALGAPPASGGTHVVAFSPVRPARSSRATPAVTAEVIAVLPAGEFAAEWWLAAEHTEADVVIQVSAEAAPEPMPSLPEESVTAAAVSPAPLLTLLAGLLAVTWRIVTRRPAFQALQHVRSFEGPQAAV